jgi:hypothetical protein
VAEFLGNLNFEHVLKIISASLQDSSLIQETDIQVRHCERSAAIQMILAFWIASLRSQ